MKITKKKRGRGKKGPEKKGQQTNEVRERVRALARETEKNKTPS